MTLPRVFPIILALLLTALTTYPANHRPPDTPCWNHVRQTDELRQLYTGGDGMALRVSAVPPVLEGVTRAAVRETVVGRLRARGLYDAEAGQWLDLSLNVGSRQFAMILSLRRWTDDLGYGLAGEITVWGLGGGGQHEGDGIRVLRQIGRHLDEFIALYVRAQRACTM